MSPIGFIHRIKAAFGIGDMGIRDSCPLGLGQYLPDTPTPLGAGLMSPCLYGGSIIKQLASAGLFHRLKECGIAKDKDKKSIICGIT